MLTQDLIIQYLCSGEHPKLLNSIPGLLARVSQLPQEERSGLLLASFILGGACWNASVKMLNAVTLAERIELFDTFRLHLRKIYQQEVAEWVIMNWKAVEDQHLQLIKYLKQPPLLQTHSVLILSLGVVFNDVHRFVQTAKMFVTYPVATVILECLSSKPKQ